MNRVSIKRSVPEVYIKESRDFQLMCDLFDLVNSGVKFDIDTITHLSDTQLCRDSMLRLLQEKLGLTLRNNVTDDTLRKILKSFPFILRHKGTKQGIAEMICLFLNIIYSDGSYKIVVENINDNNNLSTRGLGNYVVAILASVTDTGIKDIDILEDLLKYVIPAGYKIDYSINIASPDFQSTVLSDHTVYVTMFDERKENRLRSSADTANVRNNLHSVGAIVVMASESEIDDGGVNTVFGDETYEEEYIPKEDNNQ